MTIVGHGSEVPEGREHGVDDLLGSCGKAICSSVLRVRHRHVGAGDALDRRVEVVEGLLLDERREVRADAAVRPALLDDRRSGSSCAPSSRIVSRSSGRSVRGSITSASMLVLARRACSAAARPSRAIREMPTIVTSRALAADRRLAEAARRGRSSVGHLAALAVEVLVLDEDRPGCRRGSPPSAGPWRRPACDGHGDEQARARAGRSPRSCASASARAGGRRPAACGRPAAPSTWPPNM